MMMNVMEDSQVTLPKEKGWILYDGSCGFCSTWVPFWQHSLKKRGFGVAPLQEQWVREALNLDEAALLRDVRLLLVSGEVLEGAAAYRFAMQRIWWAYPLYILSVTPVVRSLFDWGYRIIAEHRYHVSRVCNLHNNAKYKH